MIKLTNKYKLKFHTEIPQEKRELLYEGIARDAYEKKGLSAPEEYGFFVENDGETIGGLFGHIFFGDMFVDVLWINPRFL